MSFELTPEQLDSLETYDWGNVDDPWGEDAYDALASAEWPRFDPALWVNYVALMRLKDPGMAPTEEFCLRVAASWQFKKNMSAVTAGDIENLKPGATDELFLQGLLPPTESYEFTVKQLAKIVTYYSPYKGTGFMLLLLSHPSVDNNFWDWVRGYIKKERLIRNDERLSPTFFEALALNPSTPADIINRVAKYVSEGEQTVRRITNEKALWWVRWLGSALLHRNDLNWVNRKIRLPALSNVGRMELEEVSFSGLLLARTSGISLRKYMEQKFGDHEKETDFWRTGLIQRRGSHYSNSQALRTVLATQGGIGLNGIPGYVALYAASWWLAGEGRGGGQRGRVEEEYWALPYLGAAKRWLLEEGGLDDSVPFEWLMEMLECQPSQFAVNPEYNFIAPVRTRAV